MSDEDGIWKCPCCGKATDVLMRPHVLYRRTELEQAKREAAKAEREACADLADRHISRPAQETDSVPDSGWQAACVAIKAAILARS